MSAPLRHAQSQDGTCAAPVVAVCQRYLPTPALRQLARNRQAQPRTAGTGTARASAMEALEDLLLLPAREPRPVVEHLDVAAINAHGHASSARIDDRVLDQGVERALGIRRSAEH